MAFTSVPTITTGDVATASWGNTYIRDNFEATSVAIVTTQGDVVYATGSKALTRLAIGAAGTFYRSTGSVPEWADPEDGAKLDGDHLDIDFTPSNYTPDASPAEAADVNDLAAHLKGIDDELSPLSQINTGTYTGDGTTSQSITGVGFQPKYVKIWPRETAEVDTETFETTDTIVDDNAGGMSINDFGSNMRTRFDVIESLDADGFTVDDDGTDSHPNQDTQVYNYLALG